MRTVFIDKDGTLIKNVPYNVNPDYIELTPGAATTLRTLHLAGYRLIVISNQSGVARGYFPPEALMAVETRLRELLAQVDVPLTGFYYCPHHPDGLVPDYTTSCSCRKPEPGLLFQAAKDHGVDLKHSWFVGDILDDMEAGRRAGCRTILFDNGNETEWNLLSQRRPHYMASSFNEVTFIIISMDGVALPNNAEYTWPTIVGE